MKLYWSSTFLANATDIRNNAKQMDVNPIAKPFDRDSFVLIKPQLNGDTHEKTLGHNQTFALSISADQMDITVKVGSDIKTIEKWLYDWEDSQFKWIQDERLDKDPVRVKMTAKPTRKRVGDDDDLLQFEYSLVTSPFTLL